MRKLTYGPAGFTLLELVVAIAILGILVSLALPSYQDSVRKARRADAQSKLRQVEVCASRVFVVDSSYADVDDDCAPAADEYYVYSFSGVTATSYLVTATPNSGQDADPCGTMTLDQAGETTAGKDSCW